MCRQTHHNLPISPISISGIRDVISDYLVDDIFIRVFHCDILRHDICVVVIEGFEKSDLCNVRMVKIFHTSVRWTLVS